MNPKWESHAAAWKEVAQIEYEQWEDNRPLVYDERDEFYYPAGRLLCPMCDAEMSEWEGQIGETKQGNEIRGWQAHCIECGWESRTFTL